ncbi:MAG TPA: RHS repeat-associated core domain-containing protein [Gammaproteobacteria bacterium]
MQAGCLHLDLGVSSHAASSFSTLHNPLYYSGLIHMNGRIYDPTIGRMLSVDPVYQAPTNSQSINPYSYVMNNPLSLVDPSGYCGTATQGSNSQCQTDGSTGPSNDNDKLKPGQEQSVTFKDPKTGQIVTITAKVNADGSVSVYDNKGTVGMNMAVVSAIQSLGSQSTTTPSATNASGSGNQGSPAQRGTVTINTQGAPEGFAADVIKAMAHTDASGIDPYNDIINKGTNLTISYSDTKHTGGEAGDDGFGVTEDNGVVTSAKLFWNPSQGMRVSGAHGPIQSPAMGLFHEAEHIVRVQSGAADLEFDPKLQMMRATEKEEDWIINHPERDAAKALGEPIRQYHWQGGQAGQQPTVPDPTYHDPPNY